MHTVMDGEPQSIKTLSDLSASTPNKRLCLANRGETANSTAIFPALVQIFSSDLQKQLPWTLPHPTSQLQKPSCWQFHGDWLTSHMVTEAISGNLSYFNISGSLSTGPCLVWNLYLRPWKVCQFFCLLACPSSWKVCQFFCLFACPSYV